MVASDDMSGAMDELAESEMSSPLTFVRRADAPEVVNAVTSNDDLQVPDGAEVRVRDYFGRRGEMRPGPQAFLVESFPAGSTTGAHFHDVDQFQVFFASEGAWYQRTPIDQVTVHYADAYTTYGPFGSGGTAMTFFTLRRQHSGITAYMPRSRDLLVSRGRRVRHGVVPADNGARSSAQVGSEPSVTELAIIAIERDGLSATLIRARPGARVAVPDSDGSTGQYLVVIDGAIVHDGDRFERMAVGWRNSGGVIGNIEADSTSGAGVLLLQFPAVTVPSIQACASP